MAESWSDTLGRWTTSAGNGIASAASATANGVKDLFNGMGDYAKNETAGGIVGGVGLAVAAIFVVKTFMADFFGGILTWPVVFLLAIPAFFAGSRGGKDVIDPWLGTGGKKTAAISPPQQQQITVHAQPTQYHGHGQLPFRHVDSTHVGGFAPNIDRIPARTSSHEPRNVTIRT